MADALPADKASLYKEMGLRLTSDLDGTVNVERRGVTVRVRGATRRAPARDEPQELVGEGD